MINSRIRQQTLMMYCSILICTLVLPCANILAKTDYSTSISTIDYFSKDSQFRMQTASLTETDKVLKNGTMQYTKNIRSGVGLDGAPQAIGFKSGPFLFTRDLKTEEITPDASAFKLAAMVMNNTIRQVEKGDRAKGTWEEKIEVNLSGYMPKNLKLTYSVLPATLKGAANDTLLVAVSAKPFTFKSAEEGFFAGRVRAGYRAVFTYSPSQDVLYQHMSVFLAAKGKETFRIESMEYSCDATGEKAMVELLDPSDYLQWTESRPAAESNADLPVWAVQALRAHSFVSLTAAVAGERGTNPTLTLFSGLPDIVTDLGKELLKQTKLGAKLVDSYDTVTKSLSDWVAEEGIETAVPHMTEGGLESHTESISKFAKDGRSAIKESNPFTRGYKGGKTVKEFMLATYENSVGDMWRAVNELAGIEAPLPAAGSAPLSHVYVHAAAEIGKTKMMDPTSLITLPVEHPYVAIGTAAGGLATVAAVSGGGGGGGGGGGSASGASDGGGTTVSGPDTSSLSGTISGGWSGSVTEDGFTETVSGSFTMTISGGGVSGSYSGDDSGAISGSVSGSGVLSAGGSAGGASWSGTISGSSGSLSGSGGWSVIGGGGGWSGSGG